MGKLGTNNHARSIIGRESAQEFAELQLQAIRHQWANEMQLIMALLQDALRKESKPETKNALRNLLGQVQIVAQSSKFGPELHGADIETAFRQICTRFNAISSQVQAVLTCEGTIPSPAPDVITALCLAVNELVANVFKHAFPDKRQGFCRVSLRASKDGTQLEAEVVDDGVAIEPRPAKPGHGSGLRLVTRLLQSKGGTLTLPSGTAKRFIIRLPLSE